MPVKLVSTTQYHSSRNRDDLRLLGPEPFLGDVPPPSRLDARSFPADGDVALSFTGFSQHPQSRLMIDSLGAGLGGD